MAASSHQQSAWEDLEQPRTFVNDLLQRITGDLKGAEAKAAEFLQDCKTKCIQLQQFLQGPSLETDDMLQDILSKTAHMYTVYMDQSAYRSTNTLVLEYTYMDEIQLVEEDFPAETCMDRIAIIQGLLDGVCDVACKCFTNKALLDSLGVELVECIRWRKGALFYMYCHTVEKQERARDPAQYRQCLEDGVRHLEAMLSTQAPQSVSSNIGPDDTLQLISQGIYSDTHLLAMMYAAEMCYWHQQASDKGIFTQDRGSGDTFAAKEHGMKHVNNYLKAVRGPLKDHGWSISQAEQILEYLQS